MEKETKSKILCVVTVVFIVLGLIMSIMGIASTFTCDDYRTSYEYYGGDAYTGIQQAAADTSKNLCEIGNMLENFFNVTYIFVGILLVTVGTYMLIKNLPEKNVDVNKNKEEYISEQVKKINE